MSWCLSGCNLRRVALSFGLIGAMFSPPALAGDVVQAQETLLAVRVNGALMPVTLLLQQPDGRILARTSDLLRWRFVVPEGNAVTHAGETFLALDAMAGVRWRIEPATQTLAIDTVAGNFLPTTMSLDGGRRGQPPPPPLGGFLNYDLTTQTANHQTTSGGLFEAVVFGPWGSLAGSAVARSGVVGKANGPAHGETVRLDTTWTLDRPGDVATWRIGDTVSRAGSWGRPLRIGGLQYGTNFGTQPGFITFPMPGLAGEAALPSTVDVYVNDALRMRRDVLAGPFSIIELPVVTGMGETRVVVRDLLGRQQTIVAPFYASTQLLRPGLRDFSYEIGAMRSNYGTASADYGRMVAVGTERRGLTDTLTGELRGEISKDRQAMGIGAAWLWPAAGVFSASVAGSRSAPGSGGLMSLGFQRQTKTLSFGGSFSATSREYVPLGQRPTEPGPQKQIVQTYASYSTPAHGSIGLNYVRQDFRHRPGAELVGASWGIALGRVGYLSLTLLRDLRGRKTQVGVNFSRSLDSRTSMSASTTSQGDSRNAQVQVQRNLPVGTGMGYQLRAAGGDITRAEGGVLAQNDYGTYGLEVASIGGRTAYRAGAAGGIAMIGSNVFASRPVHESFSVVKVPGFPDVRIYAANQLVGRTGADGTALVPRLLPYQDNTIRIEQADLPMDATVDTLSVDVVPVYRSGVLVEFPVRQSRGGLVTVVLEDGQAIPAGSVARLPGNEQAFPAAQFGEIYLTDLSKDNTVELTWRDQRCTIEVRFPETTDPLPSLGSFVCRGVKR